MRIALIQPLQRSKAYPVPVGLLCLASYVKKHDHQPIIIDFDSIIRKRGKSADFFRQAARTILKRRPQVVGFSVMCSTLPAALLIAKECKKLSPKVPIILGGPEVSFAEVDLLKTFRQVDIVVRGEGELTLLTVLEALKNKKDLSDVLGITFRKNDQVVRTPDRPFINNLNDLPYLDFSLLPNLEKYERGRIEAGRGCAFNCTFCSTCRMWRRNFRMKSPQRLAQELQQVHRLFKKNGDSYVSIVHDNFLTSRKYTDKFLSLIINKNIPWACSSRFDALNDSLIGKLKRAGLRAIFIGVESGSPRIQKEIKKNLPLSKLPRVLELLYRYNICPSLSFIIGFPNEKKEQIDQTLLLALKASLSSFSPTMQIHLFTFLKGTEIFAKARRKFKRGKFRLTDFSSPLTRLNAEIALIKKYPYLFPSFHHVNANSLDPIFMQKICVLFTFLAQFFPLTTLALIKHRSLSALRLGNKMITSFEAAGASWKFFADSESLFLYYHTFLSDFINNSSILPAKEIFRHEELAQKSHLMKDRNPRHRPRMSLDYRPRIAKEVEIRRYDFDLPGFMNRPHRKVPKGRCFIAYVPGETTQAISLGPLTHQLLLLCDGQRSVRDIIYHCLKRTTKKGIKIMLDKIRSLQRQGVISAGRH